MYLDWRLHLFWDTFFEPQEKIARRERFDKNEIKHSLN